jgi:phenolic acid decarboxylase
VVDEFAAITFVEDCGSNDENVITCAPEALPPGYTLRRNVGPESPEAIKP